MTIRLATDADKPLILKLLAELENPPYYPGDSVLQHLEDDVVLVDDVAGYVCSILRNDGFKMLRVRWLLPEAPSIPRHLPLLAHTLMAAAKRWPDMLDRRIEADFTQGKDAQGAPDGGLGACTAWSDYLDQEGIGLKPHVTRSELHPDRRWVAWWTLRKARDRIAAVLRG